jgi:hypothetical protein
VRGLVAGVLLLVAAALVPVSTTAWWLRHDVVPASAYVEAVTPLATDPAVVDEVEQQLVRQAMRAVDDARVVDRIEAALDSGLLPPAVARQLRALRVDTDARVRALVARAVRDVVESPGFVPVWQAANRSAHRQVVRVLSGGSGSVTVRPDSTVDVRLGALSADLERQLAARGLPFASALPRVDATVPVGDLQGLRRARTAYAALDTYGGVLPLVTGVLLLLGLVAARRRGLALAVTATLALLGLGVTFLALLGGRAVYLRSVPDSVSTASATAFFDAVTAGLRRDLLWVALAAGVLLVLGVVLAVVRRPRAG